MMNPPNPTPTPRALPRKKPLLSKTLATALLATALAVATLSVTGCGKKGDLTRPQTPTKYATEPKSAADDASATNRW